MRYYFSQKLPVSPDSRLAALAEMGYSPLVLLEQIHGDVIVRVNSPETGGTGDALISNTPGIFIGVKTADCVPILLYSPDVQAVAAVHAGWRGTALRIVSKTVAQLTASFGSDPSKLQAYIGPCVCQNCYHTGSDVPEALGADAGEFIRTDGSGAYVDLRAVNAHWLSLSGVRNIDISNVCTCCDSGNYWSHRRHGTNRGLQINLIGL